MSESNAACDPKDVVFVVCERISDAEQTRPTLERLFTTVGAPSFPARLPVAFCIYVMRLLRQAQCVIALEGETEGLTVATATLTPVNPGAKVVHCVSRDVVFPKPGMYLAWLLIDNQRVARWPMFVGEEPRF